MIQHNPISVPHKFLCREYQREAWTALRREKKKRAVICWHRGCGKDLFALNLLIAEAMSKPGVYLHCFPNYSQGKRAIWKSVHDTHDGEGVGYLDHFPPGSIKNINSTEMMITLKNGSIYCVMGLDGKNSARARGMNPRFVILSEYAFMDPEGWRTIEPRVKQNDGTAIFISTPNGKNHFWELFDYSRVDPSYYSSLLTIEDTKTVEPEHVEQLRKEGFPEDFIQQEYYCSFDRGSIGAYYGKLIQAARDDGRICKLPIIPDLPVHSSWDIGIGDATSIWLFQALRNGCYNFVEYYENQGEGLEHYIRFLKEWGQKHGIHWGKHFVPHDMQNREFTSGVDRLETARTFGIEMSVVPRKTIEEGIQAVRSVLPLCYFDQARCALGIKCLEFYRKKYNDALKVYYDVPCHDQYSHGCFIEGTKVLTSQGEKEIQNLLIGDLVVTPMGLRKVLKKFEYESDEILQLKIGENELSCTPNHKIFSNRGLIAADELRYNDMVFSIRDIKSCQKKYGYSIEGKNLGFRENFLSVMTEKLSYLTGLDSGKMENTTEEEEEVYTGTFGCTTMAKYLKDIMCTIKMEIMKITKYLTWKSYQLQTIPNFTTQMKEEKNQELKLRKRWSLQKNGILQKKVENGTRNTEKIVGEKEKHGLSNVSYVIKFLTQLGLIQNFAQKTASKKQGIEIEQNGKIGSVSSVIQYLKHMITRAQKHAVKSVHMKDKLTQKVYDIEVEEDHCYYANGILVSNSDSFRYFSLGAKSIGFYESSASADFEALQKFWG